MYIQFEVHVYIPHIHVFAQFYVVSNDVNITCVSWHAQHAESEFSIILSCQLVLNIAGGVAYTHSIFPLPYLFMNPW